MLGSLNSSSCVVTFLDIPREFIWFDGIRICVPCGFLYVDVSDACMLPSVGLELVVHQCVVFFGITLDGKL